MSQRDEGHQKLQTMVDASQQILPNTAPHGKDTIREDVQRLQKAWDDLIGQMNDCRCQLEGASAQWEVYEDSTGRLTKWLQEMETTLQMETSLQSTLPEKRSQSERLKVRHAHLALIAN